MEKELSEQERDLLYLFQMNDIIKVIKSLKDSGVLIDGVTETVKHKIKKTRRRVSRSFVSTFSHFISATRLVQPVLS